MRQVADSKHAGKKFEVDPVTNEKIAMINRGLVFKQTQDDIGSGKYFEQKYNLDY